MTFRYVKISKNLPLSYPFSTFKKLRSWLLVPLLHGKLMGKKKQCQISFSWAPKSLWMVTAATKLEDACSLEEKLLQTLHSILKSRDITLLTKVCIVKAIVFPVVMYGCENWTIKKAGCWRIDGFKLWCWKRLLRVPWTARRSNQSILKEIAPNWNGEGNGTPLQYYGLENPMDSGAW